jgi:hypothetical protein
MLFPKPERRSRQKARERSHESAVIRRVRAEVARLDGFCRLWRGQMGPCRGASEWAHLERFRRSRTIGWAPEDRHRVDGTLMLCDGHHDDYDQHRMDIEELTPRGTRGALRFKRTRDHLYPPYTEKE